MSGAQKDRDEAKEDSPKTTETKPSEQDPTKIIELNIALIELYKDRIIELKSSMATYRARFTWTLFLGPYLVFGSFLIATKSDGLWMIGNTLPPNLWPSSWSYLHWILYGGFIGMAFLGAAAETAAAYTIHRWMRIVYSLYQPEKYGLCSPVSAKFELELKAGHSSLGFILYYVLAFHVIGALFFTTLKLIAVAATSKPPEPSGFIQSLAEFLRTLLRTQ